MFSTEALDGIDEVVNPQVPVTEEELNVVVSDVQQDDAECAAIENDIERFEGAAVALESMFQKALPLTQSATDADVRHLTTSVYAVANASRFSLGRSLALEELDDQTPTQKGSRIVAKIKEYALRLWSMLTDAFERVVDWFTQFLQKVTNAAGRLRNRAEQILKKNKEVSDGLKKGAQMSLPGHVASVLGVVEGTPQDAVKNLSQLVSGLVAAGNAKYLDHLFAAIDKLAKTEDGEHDINKLVDAIQKTYNPIFEYEAPDYEFPGGEAVEIGATEVLPGNYHGYMAIPKNGIGLGYFRYDLSNALVGTLTKDQGLPVLSHRDIDAVLGYVIDITKTYQNIAPIESELKKIKDKLAQTRTIIEKSIEKDKATALDESTVEIEKFKSGYRVQVLRGVLSFLPRATASIHQKTMSFALTKCKSVLYWAEWSRSQYEPKSA